MRLFYSFNVSPPLHHLKGKVPFGIFNLEPAQTYLLTHCCSLLDFHTEIPTRIRSPPFAFYADIVPICVSAQITHTRGSYRLLLVL